ncbi:probable sodium/potassium/calcium exchanger CG1090 [Melitaea cinxia]|uniref:probable sodium/potassium/calcium exchanger CG1090 n=1 Tax=Melitaea cinxia TaxID=113334 RepID=UPI001E2705B3|nr:probable sodium/potassium/calcium exchanger CG1090 [Melitaea cinxia]
MQSSRMRKPRRHRWLTVSVFFIAYSVFQGVLSNASEPADQADKTADVVNPSLSPEIARTTNVEGPKVSDVTPAVSDIDENVKANGKKAMKGFEDEGEKKKQKDAGYEEDKGIIAIRDEEEREEEIDAIPTVHPLRNCTPPAIEQFPKPLMGQTARKHGGLILHILVAVFTFIGLAIVCDEYFVSSLDRICEELKLAPDVAGATFMAAGSSAPELATVVIGVFCAQDDIGVSGVIGSAVFNIMFVISVCALCAGTVSHLNWWPLCRDCFFYAISILVMLCTIANGYVSWPEALFMLIMYGVYCLALRFNNALERWALTIPLPFKLPSREEQAALVTYNVGGQAAGAPAAEGQYAQMEGQNKDVPQEPTAYNPDGAYDNAAYNADPAAMWDPNQTWDPDRAWNESSMVLILHLLLLYQQQPAPAPAPVSQSWGDSMQRSSTSVTSPDPPAAAPQPQPQPQPQVPAQPAYYKAKEYNPETAVDPLVKPIGANHLQLACWYVAYPIHWSCRHTMPDCRGRWYPITFIISMLWISFYSYFMVWMITIIGYTLGIPDTVMGLTFVAAGVSVPDALSSLAVIKEGYGDMAVSNAVGSNVFDILVCLGLPWFIQTAIIHPGSHVNVISKGLIYSTLSLFSTVVFLVVATHANGWKLDRKFGAVLMVWYLLFITLASLYELNVFGNIHPPDCESTY